MVSCHHREVQAMQRSSTMRQRSSKRLMRESSAPMYSLCPMRNPACTTLVRCHSEKHACTIFMTECL